MAPVTLLIASAAVLLSFLSYRSLKRSPRPSVVPVREERVLVLGGTSGVGRSIAHVYARRGASVCVVGRRKGLLDEVQRECALLGAGGVLSVCADFAQVDDMVKVRRVLEDEWRGVDTVIVVAGVSALRPLMITAGVDTPAKGHLWAQASRDGIQRSIDIAAAATKGNYLGPLLAAVTFIPLLINTSRSPSILLFSSVAALIPAPTRSIYASTKAASLLLYQSISIEHPSIAFTMILPGTIEGEFRASAVDGALGPDDPKKVGMKKDVVAERAVRAVDWRERRVWMPGYFQWGHAIYWIWSPFTEWMARVKYRWN